MLGVEVWGVCPPPGPPAGWWGVGSVPDRRAVRSPTVRHCPPLSRFMKSFVSRPALVFSEADRPCHIECTSQRAPAISLKSQEKQVECLAAAGDWGAGRLQG